MVPPSLTEILCRQFSLSEIKSATNNFSTDLIVGKGSFGYVFKGTMVLIPGNTATVAVKRRGSDSKQGLHEFWTEVKLLSHCWHSHVISLIGYCFEQDANEMILVYEYMPNGTLADHIYKKSEKSVFLSWEQRLKICIGVGRGLEYLHTGTGINQIVIHRDLKSSNILLDENLEPRISDFGLCENCRGNPPDTPIIASVKGTRGYMDPKYLNTRELSTKTDVYGVGVVLLEVLCGRRSLDFEVADRQKRLVLWAEQCVREGVAYRIIDPGLRGSIADDGLRIYLDITLKCVQDHPKKRPTLAEVVGRLDNALASQYTTYSSSSSVDDDIFTHFNQVAYSSTSANSGVDPSRHTVETGSSKSDTIQQDPGSEPSSKTNNFEVPVDLQNVSIPTSSKTDIRLSDDKDDELEKLFERVNPLSVVINNKSRENATIIEVNCINRQEILLEAIQVLTDIGLIFTRASMTSDGLWSLHVFGVTNQEGNKVKDEKILDYIQTVLGSGTSSTGSIKPGGLPASADLTVIELIGSDRPGLLSEVCAVLLDLRCHVMKLNVWTHNTRAAFIILLTDEESGAAVTDPSRFYNIKKRFRDVFTVSNNEAKGANVVVTHGVFHTECRLHQMMLADCGYERDINVDLDKSRRPDEKDYSLFSVQCLNRPKLLFDIICTITDMNYVVLHGNVKAYRTEAYQEYHIRRLDGSAVGSDAERQIDPMY